MPFDPPSSDNRAPRPVWPIVLILACCLFFCTGLVGLVAWGVVSLVEVSQQEQAPRSPSTQHNPKVNGTSEASGTPSARTTLDRSGSRPPAGTISGGTSPLPKAKPDPIPDRKPTSAIRFEEVPILPSKITEPTTIDLPNKVGHACFAGGGRYLVLHLFVGKKLAIFDVSEGKVVRTIDVPEGVRFAAGMNVLMTWSGIKDPKVARYRLSSGEKEAEYPAYQPLPVDFICMGHGGNGPLIVGYRNAAAVVDVQTMQSRSLLGLGQVRSWAGRDPNVFVQNSFAGVETVYLAMTIGSSDRGVTITKVQRNTSTPGLPSADFRHIFIGRSVYGLDPTSKTDNYSKIETKGEPWDIAVPAAEGDTFVAINVSNEKKPTASLAVRRIGGQDPVAELGKIPWEKFSWPDGAANESSAFLVPRARLAVVIDDERNKLRLYPVKQDQ